MILLRRRTQIKMINLNLSKGDKEYLMTIEEFKMKFIQYSKIPQQFFNK